MANKEHSFTVNLTFSEKVGKKKLEEIATKIADALRHECDSGNGLAPENSEAFTERIEVYLGEDVEPTVIVRMETSKSVTIINK